MTSRLDSYQYLTLDFNPVLKNNNHKQQLNAGNNTILLQVKCQVLPEDLSESKQKAGKRHQSDRHTKTNLYLTRSNLIGWLNESTRARY